MALMRKIFEFQLIFLVFNGNVKVMKGYGYVASWYRLFLEVYDSFKQQGVPEDALQLNLFLYSGRDHARAWLNALPSGMVAFWNDFCQRFLLWYNPPNMNAKLRNDLTSFRQLEDETMVVDASANGTLLDKSYNEAHEILERIANNDYQYPTTRVRTGRKVAGTMELDAITSLIA
ncbi:protein FAR1-RELATED SEQUENCE 5-like [Gossypium australe]|uniref:Protein FAR1-RELATED SEQUENCE 5-like n=1 Tax=Gossypium australe TaxID=47621 RepID=A0A5B6X2J2_9ROSI|nr:protein FAR1-RELATED SEQUENCE 5-like [Gossypium australe]